MAPHEKTRSEDTFCPTSKVDAQGITGKAKKFLTTKQASV
jgi:hypothetical protein